MAFPAPGKDGQPAPTVVRLFPTKKAKERQGVEIYVDEDALSAAEKTSKNAAAHHTASDVNFVQGFNFDEDQVFRSDKVAHAPKPITWVNEAVQKCRRALAPTRFDDCAVDYSTSTHGARYVEVFDTPYVNIETDSEYRASQAEHDLKMAKGDIYTAGGAKHPYEGKKIVDQGSVRSDGHSVVGANFLIDGEFHVSIPKARTGDLLRADTLKIQGGVDYEMPEEGRREVFWQSVMYYHQYAWRQEVRYVYAMVDREGYVCEDDLNRQFLEGAWVDSKGNACAHSGEGLTQLAYVKA